MNLHTQLGVSPRIAARLTRAGAATVSDITTWSMDDLRDIRGVGPGKAATIAASLAAAGVTLRPNTREQATQ